MLTELYYKLKYSLGIQAKIDMTVERDIWQLLFDAPDLVKQKFNLDCRFVRTTQPYCDSNWKHAHLRGMLKQWEQR